MLSFDKELYRLGYGGGYYDKSINILKKHFKKERNFLLQLVLHIAFKKKKIPKEKHDMKLDYIITEKEVL